jgi:phosphotriesterase-related protein
MILTVLGPVDPLALGPTSMHEHCLTDATVWVRPPREDWPRDLSLTIENLGFLRWNFDSLEENLRLDDSSLAAIELGRLSDIPGATIVDLTTIGLGRQPAALPAISREAGVHIVAGCGFYVHDAYPEWAHRLSVDDIAAFLVTELCEGIGDTGIQAGLIGEIGTSNPPTEREIRTLRGAGRAATMTGAAVNVHIDPFGRHALAVIEALLSEGMPADRIVVSHMDAHRALDHGYHAAVAETGAVLEFDNFGLEYYTTQTTGLVRNNTDLERLEHLGRLLSDGLAPQLVLGVDVYTKAQLRRYGGTGYDHLLKRIVPFLRDQLGTPDDVLNQMLVDTPRRVLDRPG